MTWNSKAAFIFIFGLRKGQCRAKLAQIRPSFEIRHFLTKYTYLVQLCFRIQKILFIFTYDNFRNTKNALKSDVISFPCFFFVSAEQPKKDSALKLCICIVIQRLYNIYFLLDNITLLDFVGNFI